MTTKTSSQEARIFIKKSYLEAACYAFMVGATESFALFYAVQKNLSVEKLALLSTLPILVGSLGQWLVPWFCRPNKLRTFTLLSYAFQLVGLVLLCVATFQEHFFPWLFSALCFYWLGGMTSAPLWLEWVGGQIPPSVFRNFLCRRNAFVSGVTLITYLASAIFLQKQLSGQSFLIVFSLACASRFVGFLLQAEMSRSAAIFSEKKTQSLAVSEKSRQKKALLVLFLGCFLFKFSVNLSSPFFLPYLVKQMHFSLLEYTLLTSVPFLGRFLFLANWGRAAFGIRPVLGVQIAALGIAINPILWTLATKSYHLVGLELISGIMWGGFELCTILSLQCFCSGKAIRVVGAFMALSNLGALLGGLCGAQIFHWLGSFHSLFVVSTQVRLLAALLMVLMFIQIKDLRFRVRHYGEFLITTLSPRLSLSNSGRVLFIRQRIRHRLSTETKLKFLWKKPEKVAKSSFSNEKR